MPIIKMVFKSDGIRESAVGPCDGRPNVELDEVAGAEPAGAAAGAEADDQRPPRLRMADRAEQSEHHLRAGVGAGAAVRLAVHDERVAGRLRTERDAAFDAVAFPDDGVA